jgi:hypothetical protein
MKSQVTISQQKYTRCLLPGSHSGGGKGHACGWQSPQGRNWARYGKGALFQGCPGRGGYVSIATLGNTV